MKIKIGVVDGKGGGLGKSIIETLSKNKDKYEIIALGTNSYATTQMLKAGANDAATGENAICHMVNKVDYVIGPIAIIAPNSMMGEITEKISLAIGKSETKKILLPLDRCGIHILGTNKIPINQLLSELPELIK